MNIIKHLKGNFIVSAAGVGAGLASKYLLKKEFIAVSSTGQMIKSFFFILTTTIAGKLVMDRLYEKHWVPYSAGGKDRAENEGFIGPLSADLDFIGPPHSG